MPSSILTFGENLALIALIAARERESERDREREREKVSHEILMNGKLICLLSAEGYGV